MSGYTFTIHECGGGQSAVAIDRALAGPEDIRSAAIEIARTIMAKEVSHGRLCLTCWIVVANDQGHNILTLQFGDAVAMVEHTACAPAGAAPHGSSLQASA